MKLDNLKSKSLGIAMTFLTLGSLTIQSCTKDEQNKLIENSGQLTVSARGINSEALFKSANVTKEDDKLTLHSYNDVDVAVAISPISESDRLKFKSSTNFEPLDEDTKYTIYFYDGEELITSKELTAGSNEMIEGLNPSTNYTWVALSYNSSSDAPSLTPSTTLNLPVNTDVLYKKGTINLSNNSSLEILFDRAMARVGIELNTVGIFGTINNTPQVSVTTTGLKSGVLDLLTGEVTPNEEASSPTLTYADFTPVDSAADAVEAYLYTAPSSSQQFITVNVRNLQIKHYDDVDGDVLRTYFNSANGADFTLNITPEKAKSQKAVLNLVESALTTTFNNRTVQWARSNLYYRGDNDIRSYAFYAQNQQTSRADGYFGFKSTIPMRFATTSTEGDPCSLVYPQGLWRQPLKADFNGLVDGDLELSDLTAELGAIGSVVDATGLDGLIDVIGSLLDNSLGALINIAAPNSSLDPNSPYNYGQYTIAQGAPASGSNAFGTASSSLNTLRFFYNGQITNLNALRGVANGQGLLNLGLNDLSVDIAGTNILGTNISLLDSYGDVTALWTSEQGSDILGLVGAGTWGYLGNAGRGFSYETVLGLPVLTGLNDRFHMANNTGELLNGIDALGIGVLSTSLKNVRCVRAR